MSREGITRRDFLKVTVVVAACAACRHGLPKFTEQLCAPEDGLHTSVLEAHRRANEFLNRNSGLISLMHEKIPHPQLQRNLLVQARFLPPLADRTFLAEMEDSFNTSTPEAAGLSDEDRLLLWSDRIHEIFDLDFRLHGWNSTEIISRWARHKTPFKEPDQLETHGSVRRLDERYPIPSPIVILPTGSPIRGFYRNDEITAGVGDFIFGRKIEAADRERLLGAVLCHEIAHALDITSNPNLIMYIPDNVLAELYRLRLEAVDLVGISNAPYYDSHGLVHRNEEVVERNQLTLVARAVYGDIHTMIAEKMEKIKWQAMNYPREVLEKRLIDPTNGETLSELSHRTMGIIQGSDTELLLPEDEKKLAMYLSSMHSEHFAELVGAYLYLMAGFEGEVDDRLLKDLRKNEAIQYVDLIINSLNRQTFNEIKDVAMEKVCGVR